MWHIKLVKRGIIGLVVLLGLGIAGLEILSRVYQEKAGAFFREKFSQQSDLVLQPFQTTVSVWTHFPRITFRLKELSLVDTSGGQPVQVLRVGRTEIAVPLGQFNLNRLQINQLILTDVLFRQRIDSAGNKIGLRFKKIENPDTSATQVPFVIPKLLIRNARFISENQYKQSGFSVQVGEASLRASLKDQVLQIDGKVSGRVDSITSKQVVLFRNELFTGAVQYAYNLSQKTGRISNTSLVLNQHPIRVAGTHTTLPQGAGNGLDLKISGDQPILYVLTQLLPPQAKTFLSHIKSKSNLQFSLHITGASGPVTRPRNLIKFALRNGEVYLPATKTSIGQVTLVGEMDNGILQKPESSRLIISEFSANTREDSFRVALEVSNFLKPAFHFTGQGRMRLEKLAAFVKLPVTRITGGAVVGKVNLSGILPDSLHPKTPDWRGQGSVVLQKASFRPLGLTIDCQEVNGGIRFTDDLLDLQGLQGTIGGHPFSVQASVKNFLAYLFDQPGAVTAKASIYAATLNTDWLDQQALGRKNKDMAGASKNGAVNSGSAGVQSALEGLASQVNLRVDKLQLPAGEKVLNLVMQVDQLEGKVKLTRMRFSSSGGGTATADGGFQVTHRGIQEPYLNVQLKYPELDLQSLLQNLAALKEMRKPAPASAAKKSGKRSGSDFLKEEDYRLNLLVKADKIRYLHLNGTDLLLRASLNSQEIKIAQLDLNSSGGQIHVRGNMQLNATGQKYPVRLRAELHHLNLQQLFVMAENMKLDVLGSDNIRGTVECNLTVFTELDKFFIPRLDLTTAYARATLLNLELIEVAPIQNALKMIRKERTRHLYFEDLTTDFILANNQFLTPGLPMISNLTALNLSGTYTMGGGADMNMDVGVMNILVGNNKRRIEKIQAGDTTLAPNFENKQHLVITRHQQKYKVNLSNRKQREERMLALKQEFRHLIRKHQIDTVFTVRN